MAVYFYIISYKKMSKIRQPVNDLNKIYQKSEEAKPDFQKLIEDVAMKTGGKAKIAPLKRRERAEQKIQTDYEGDASKIKDILRASIIYKKYEQVESGLKQLQEDTKVVALKDRFAKPTPAGYRDALLNIQTKNGIIAEVQLHLEPILEAKKEGHKYYEQQREIQAKLILEDRDPSLKEEALLDNLEAKQRSLYDDAFARATQNQQTSQSQPNTTTENSGRLALTKQNKQWAKDVYDTASYIFQAQNNAQNTQTVSDGIKVAKGNNYNIELNRDEKTLTISSAKDSRTVAKFDLQKQSVIESNPTPTDKQNWSTIVKDTQTNIQSTTQKRNKPEIND